MKRLVIIAFALMLLSVTAKSEIQLKTIQQYPVGQSPEMFCTNGLSCYYTDEGNSVYNFANIELLKTRGTIKDIRILPTGTAFYALYSDKYNIPALTTDNLFGKSIVSRLNSVHPSCFCFSSDASKILTAGSDSKIHIYSILNNQFKEIKTLDERSQSIIIAASPNLYYIVTASDSELKVYCYDTAQLRISLNIGVKAKKIVFTSDSRMMYVLCDDAAIYCFDTTQFNEIKSIRDLGQALSFDITNDGKYLAVATSDSCISIINSYNPANRQSIEIPDGGIASVCFIKFRNGAERLAYNTKKAMVFSELYGREANYTKLISEEVEKKMDEWLKQMPGESLEAYSIRVSDENRAKQMALCEEEISTKMAEGILQAEDISLGSYDEENGLLSLKFSTMPSIFLKVEASQVASFSDVENLEFCNPRYGVTAEDNFELVYVEVRNKKSGECFIFDNRDRKSLEYLRSSDKFVPMELLKQSNMESLALEEIKDNILRRAKSSNVISHHTHISVDTKIEKDVDASGKRILNYKISMGYYVDAEFSASEDYPSGGYRVEESGAAKALCEIISQAFAGEFNSYIKSGKKVIISLNGAADASAIKNAIAYNGIYGVFADFPVYDNGVLCNVSVNPKKGIRTNDELAFIRAAGLKEEISKSVVGLEEMSCTYIYNIRVSSEVGSEHRRVSVSFIFPDAL